MRIAALLAVSLAALTSAASAAAKPVIDNEGHAFLSVTLLGGHATDGGAQIQVRSLKWSAPPSAGPVRVISGEVFYKPPARSSGHSMLGASESITVAGAQTQYGQATGKRQHMPLRSRVYYDQSNAAGRSLAAIDGEPVQGAGTLTVSGGFTGCQVGARYAGMQFAAAGKRYELEDVVISNCPTAAGPREEITFVYGKVTVRGWDPEKKEE